MITTLRSLTRPMLKFFASLMNNIIVAVLVGTLGVSTLIAWVTGTLDFAIQYVNTPTPLWVTILLVFLCFLYTYVRVVKFPAMLKAKDQSSEPPLKTIFHDNILWLTDGSGPYCPVCCDADHKFIHMLTNPMGHLECPICKHYANISQPPDKNC